MKADGQIGVLIVDDHLMFAESLGRLLEDEAGIAVLGVATSGKEALALLARLHPRVVLIDYHMPEHDGVEVAAEMKRRDPDTMVVMLTSSANDRTMVAAIEAGCSGFLTKDRAASEVASAVKAAAAGEALISPAMLARLLPKLTRRSSAAQPGLTDREFDVFRLMAHGLTNKAIGSQLHLSVNTVRNYGQSVLAKLGAHSKLEAVAIGVRTGVIEYPAS